MKALRFIDQNFEKIICTCLFILVVALIFFQVLSRYVIKGIYWAGTEELARYTYVWMVFLGASMLVRQNSHLKVDILAGTLGPKKAVYLDIIWEIVAIIFFFRLLPNAWKVFATSFKLGKTYPSSLLPQALFQFSLPTMCFMMVLRDIQMVILQIRGIIKEKKGGEEK